MCSLYRGFFYNSDQKKCSLFRVERCSLYRGLFTAKIYRAVGKVCSNRRCSLCRGVHWGRFYCILSHLILWSLSWNNICIRLGHPNISNFRTIYKNSCLMIFFLFLIMNVSKVDWYNIHSKYIKLCSHYRKATYSIHSSLFQLLYVFFCCFICNKCASHY